MVNNTLKFYQKMLELIFKVRDCIKITIGKDKNLTKPPKIMFKRYTITSKLNNLSKLFCEMFFFYVWP